MEKWHLFRRTHKETWNTTERSRRLLGVVKCLIETVSLLCWSPCPNLIYQNKWKLTIYQGGNDSPYAPKSRLFWGWFGSRYVVAAYYTNDMMFIFWKKSRNELPFYSFGDHLINILRKVNRLIYAFKINKSNIKYL
jgi:hypothetical protein